MRSLSTWFSNTEVLKEVTLDVPARLVTGVIGPSGCGKSTFLRILNRLSDEDRHQRVEGQVLLDGANIFAPRTHVDVLRGRVAMVFQEPTVFPMSIFGNIAFALSVNEALTRAQTRDRVEALLTRSALWQEVKDRLDEPAEALSGGQQQRLCFARALATRPEVLLLDEPTSALDPISMEAVEQLIIDLKREVTIVLVTHNMNQARRCADQIAFLYLGELVELGLTQQMFSAPAQKRTQAYLSGRFG